MKTSPRHSIVLQLILMLAAIIIPSCGKGVDTSDIMMLQQLEEAGISTSGFVDLGLSVKWAACPGGADRPWYVAEILYSDEMESYLNNHLKPNGMRYPTLKELYELQNNCRWERFVITSDEYDYKGLKVTGPNGNSIYVDSDIFSCTYSGPGSWYDRDEYYILRINDYYDDQLIMYVGPTYIGAIRGVYDDGSPLDHGTYAGDNGGDDNNGGQGGNGGTTDPTGGKVSGKIKVYGEGLNYSSYAQSINGNSVTVEWVYYPKTGKYAFYGGNYCSSPDSNGGKGLLYDCQKGYNSVKIDSDYASSSGHYREWKYEVYVQFTIP